MIKKTIICCFFILGLFLVPSCNILHDDAKNIFSTESQLLDNIPFEQVLYVENSDFSESSQGSMETEAEWCKLWDSLYETKCDTGLVDFEKELAIYVALGLRANTCYALKIASISRTEKTLNIFYDEIIPGESCLCAQWIVTPLEVVKIDRHYFDGVEEVKFHHNTSVNDCP